MSSSTPARLRTVLANRHDVLCLLVAEPATKPELVDALDAARSTIDRAVRDLTDVDCVEPVDGRYRASTAGRIALSEHDEYRSGSEAVHDATAFVNALPVDSPPGVEMLRGCEITLAEPHAPEIALGHSIEVLDRATSMKGLAPVLLSRFPPIIVERVGGATSRSGSSHSGTSSIRSRRSRARRRRASSNTTR